MNSAAFLQLSGISKTFRVKSREVVALDNVSLDVERRSFVSLVGHSGCGKSTLLRIIAGLETATTGQISLEGRKLAEAAKGQPFGFVFQDAALLPWKTLLENVRLPLDILGRGTVGERNDAARQAIEMVRLTGFDQHFPDHLSGGMRQRAAIARALVYRPDVLLMDEPFGALDDFTRREMSDELLRIWEENACTVLFVTHSLPEAVLLSDRVVVLDSKPGRVRELVDIALPRPRSASVRESADFTDHVRYLERLIFGEGRQQHEETVRANR